VPLAQADRLDQVLLDAAKGQADVVVTEGMRCAARELARVHVRKQGWPAPRAMRFLLGRCGAPYVFASTQVMTGDVPDGTPIDEVTTQWAQQLGEMAREGATAGRATGIGMFREGGKIAFVVASVPHRAIIKPYSLAPGADGVVVLEGKLLLPAIHMTGWIGRGTTSAARCEADATIALPAFRFRCTADAHDGVAAVSLGAFEEGRVLGESIVDAIVLPSGAAANKYEPVSYAAATPRPAGDEATARELLRLVNDVRAGKQLAPLRSADAQARTAQRLAPHFFAAMFDATDTDADRVALAMLAGWEVDGLIRDGGFAYGASFGGGDLADLLGSALDEPVVRQVLLGPDVDAVAFGPMHDAKAGMHGVLVATYDLFDGAQPADGPGQVMKALTAARRQRGASAPGLLAEEVDAKAAIATAALVQGDDPSAVMNKFLKDSVKVMRMGMTGWMFETHSLDDIVFPPDFLAAPALHVSIAVATRKPRDAPWGNYTVLVVAKELDQAQVATGPRTGGGA
jgi:hypothetical protein